MKIITDSGANLSPEDAQRLGIQVVPFKLTFAGRTYVDGVELTAGELYQKMQENPDLFPTTSQPAAGEFAAAYQAAGPDEEVLSIHISGGLSGTLQSAQAALGMLKDARVMLVDSRTLSVPLGWLARAAARVVQGGVSLETARDKLLAMRENMDALFTLTDMRYLIHGGRISHLRGLLASLLRIKPVIGVGEDGRYETRGQDTTLKKALRRMAELAVRRFPGQRLHVQFLHGDFAEGVEMLRAALSELTQFTEGAVERIPAALGAHTGPNLVGLAYTTQETAEAAGL
jgi:DegV family protein with EDD domain